jgi:hypothetical protein
MFAKLSPCSNVRIFRVPCSFSSYYEFEFEELLRFCLKKCVLAYNFRTRIHTLIHQVNSFSSDYRLFHKFKDHQEVETAVTRQLLTGHGLTFLPGNKKACSTI